MKKLDIFFCIAVIFLLMGIGLSGKYKEEAVAEVFSSSITEETRMTGHDMKYLSWRIWIDYLEEKEQEAYEQQRKLDQWRLILVNFEHPLGEDYAVRRIRVGNYQYVDTRIAKELNAMIEAALEDGIDICVVSGYRSYGRQVSLYNQKIRRLKRQGYSEEDAVKEAGAVVAVPGTSEHMTGLAVDLVTAEDPRLEEFQEDSNCYQWLIRHCAEYGFIVRYPEGKSEITGIIYEPWHFRYVGKEHAKIIMENGWCLEEYLEHYPELRVN